MESLVEQSNKNSPNQKIIPSGYSEGAMVVYIAVNGLSVEALNSIAVSYYFANYNFSERRARELIGAVIAGCHFWRPVSEAD